MSTNDESCRLTHARVRFAGSAEVTSEVKVVPLNKIIEFRTKFPEHRLDFDKSFIYTMLYTDEKNPTEIETPVYISDIMDSASISKVCLRRGRFAKPNTTILNDYYMAHDYDLEDNIDDDSKIGEYDDDDGDNDDESSSSEHVGDETDKDQRSSKDLSSKEKQKSKRDINRLRRQKKRDLKEQETEIQKIILKEKMDTMINGQTLTFSTDTSTTPVNVVEGGKHLSTTLNNDSEGGELKKQYENLQSQHNTLQSKCTQLEKRCESLQALNEGLQVQLLKALEGKQSNAGVLHGREKHSPINKNWNFDNLFKSPTGFDFNEPLNNSTPANTMVHQIETPKSDRTPTSKNSVLSVSVDEPKKKARSRKRLFTSEETSEKQEEVLEENELRDDEAKKRTKQMNGYSDEIESFNQVEVEITEEASALKGIEKTKDENYDDVDLSDEESKVKVKETKAAKKNEKKTKENFLKTFKKLEGGELVTMVHLVNGLYMSLEDWNFAMKADATSLFTKRILRKIYTTQQLIQRCIKEGENVRTPNGKNKRKQVTPVKLNVVETCVRYYIHSTTATRGKVLIEMAKRETAKYVGEDINKLIQKIKSKKKSADDSNEDNQSLNSQI